MSRLTRNIRLVLISSSLTLYGCQNEPDDQPTCRQYVSGGGGNATMPPVCGPVGGGAGSSGYHGFTHSYWGGGHTASGAAGRSGIGGSARGGFGSSGHGVGS